MQLRLTFAIGDVHGCYEELRTLLRLCDASAGPLGHDFVLLGDYVDRGPASSEVIEYLMREQAADPSPFRCLRGNHDDMLSAAADPGRSADELIRWVTNGGGATLDAYGVDDPGKLPADHLAWIGALPFSLREHDRFFVHAGARPGVPLAAQSPHDMMWIRRAVPVLGGMARRARRPRPQADPARHSRGPDQSRQCRYWSLLRPRADGRSLQHAPNGAAVFSQQQRSQDQRRRLID